MGEIQPQGLRTWLCYVQQGVPTATVLVPKVLAQNNSLQCSELEMVV